MASSSAQTEKMTFQQLIERADAEAGGYSDGDFEDCVDEAASAPALLPPSMDPEPMPVDTEHVPPPTLAAHAAAARQSMAAALSATPDDEQWEEEPQKPKARPIKFDPRNPWGWAQTRFTQVMKQFEYLIDLRSHEGQREAKLAECRLVLSKICCLAANDCDSWEDYEERCEFGLIHEDLANSSFWACALFRELCLANCDFNAASWAVDCEEARAAWDMDVLWQKLKEGLGSHLDKNAAGTDEGYGGNKYKKAYRGNRFTSDEANDGESSYTNVGGDAGRRYGFNMAALRSTKESKRRSIRIEPLGADQKDRKAKMQVLDRLLRLTKYNCGICHPDRTDCDKYTLYLGGLHPGNLSLEPPPSLGVVVRRSSTERGLLGRWGTRGANALRANRRSSGFARPMGYSERIAAERKGQEDAAHQAEFDLMCDTLFTPSDDEDGKSAPSPSLGSAGPPSEVDTDDEEHEGAPGAAGSSSAPVEDMAVDVAPPDSALVDAIGEGIEAFAEQAEEEAAAGVAPVLDDEVSDYDSDDMEEMLAREMEHAKPAPELGPEPPDAEQCNRVALWQWHHDAPEREARYKKLYLEWQQTCYTLQQKKDAAQAKLANGPAHLVWEREDEIVADKEFPQPPVKEQPPVVQKTPRTLKGRVAHTSDAVERLRMKGYTVRLPNGNYARPRAKKGNEPEFGTRRWVEWRKEQLFIRGEKKQKAVEIACMRERGRLKKLKKAEDKVAREAGWAVSRKEKAIKKERGTAWRVERHARKVLRIVEYRRHLVESASERRVMVSLLAEAQNKAHIVGAEVDQNMVARTGSAPLKLTIKLKKLQPKAVEYRRVCFTLKGIHGRQIDAKTGAIAAPERDPYDVPD